jgi:hypothetical protein
MDIVPGSFEIVRRSTFGASGVRPLARESRRAPLSRFGGLRAETAPRDDYLEAVVDYLSAVIDPIAFYVGTLDPGGQRIRTIIAAREGERVDNFTINLADTPCSAVLGPQALCIYTDGVADLFPRAHHLRALGAEGFVGMPLLSRDGAKIGIVAAVTQHPIENIDEIRSALYTFGGFLSLVVERQLLAAAGADTSEIDSIIATTQRSLAGSLRHRD